MANSNIVVCVLLAFLLVSTITDVAWHKIFNWNTYGGIVTGFVIRFASEGVPGLLDSAAGCLACGLVMLFCFVLFNIGGGDVKLIAMIGAFLGLEKGIETMLWTFVLGSLMGAAYLIWQIGFLRMVRKCIQHLFLAFRAKSWIPLSEEEREPLKRWLYLAPSGLAAVCVVMFVY